MLILWLALGAAAAFTLSAATADEQVFICRELSAVGFENISTDGADGTSLRPLDRYKAPSQIHLRRYFVRMRDGHLSVALSESGPRYFRYRCQAHYTHDGSFVCTSRFNETMTINVKALRFAFANVSGFVDVPNPLRLSFGRCEMGAAAR